MPGDLPEPPASDPLGSREPVSDASASDAARPEPTRPTADAGATPDSNAGPDRGLAIDVARLIADDKCEDVVVFDTRGLSPVTNYVVLGTGQSDRQIRAVGGHVSELARERDFARFGTDEDQARTWVVLDFVDVMVHLFEPATRAHYDLEMLWGDAPRVSWRRG
ncbi:MAG: ribosome silencing factor [Planctomycetota bacterium]